MSSRLRHRKAGGRRAKHAARQHQDLGTAAFIERKIPYFEVLDEEGLQTIENNADTVLEEVGIEFTDFPEALNLFKEAGADIDGERVRFPRGFCRSIIQASAPAEYTQHARNPERNVIIGGKRTVLVPAYGPPFVRDLDKGRRYATIEDFRNFIKLAYMSPGEIGIEFTDFPEALNLFKEAGADIDGERVRFPRGFCRSIIQASAPAEYTQHARNPERESKMLLAHSSACSMAAIRASKSWPCPHHSRVA